ncbi:MULTISPECIES: type II secretion system protein J [unclassified Allomuricauda]|uniref:PulJ/GspJ family protein n=1 Tax=unclassified Allomuricauda TaxID=2615049 RepID=UPI00273D5698|nr:MULTISPECIES: prepilin-type N-terminal cleavage/methylation domain-containing protein [unclassified Allomuricauda]
MNTLTQRIKAFTLHEMLVVLLITALVVGMAYSVLRLVQVQMSGIASNYSEAARIRRLKQSLWADFHSHDRIWYESETKEMIMVNELQQVRYHFMEQMVVKAQDTFKVDIRELTPYFKAEPVTNGEIDALDLYMRQHNRVRLFVYKENAATSYID